MGVDTGGLWLVAAVRLDRGVNVDPLVSSNGVVVVTCGLSVDDGLAKLAGPLSMAKACGASEIWPGTPAPL